MYIFLIFNHPAPTEIYTLSLHDALPILSPGCWYSTTSTMSTSQECSPRPAAASSMAPAGAHPAGAIELDRKSTRLNSSHLGISYAVFCLKKKKKTHTNTTQINYR